MGSPNPGWSLQSALSLQNYMLPSLCTNWKINHWEWDYFSRDTGLSQTGDSYQSTKVWGNKQSDCQGGYDYLTGSSILKKCYNLTNSSKNNWDLRDQLRSTQRSQQRTAELRTPRCASVLGMKAQIFKRSFGYWHMGQSRVQISTGQHAS